MENGIQSATQASQCIRRSSSSAARPPTDNTQPASVVAHTNIVGDWLVMGFRGQ